MNAQALQSVSKYAGATVLAIGAHPDDVELGVGGTLASLSELGARVVIAVVSIPSHLELRREESHRAAELLGCELRLLIPDRLSRVEDLKNHELVAMVDALINELAPAAVFTHCSANFHLDHRLVHEACVVSQRLGVFDLLCYSPTSCRPINVPFAPHAFVDISDKIDLKMQAIHSHFSQFGRRGLSADHCRAQDRHYGQLIGVEYAEGLEIARMRLTLAKEADGFNGLEADGAELAGFGRQLRTQ